VCNDSAYAVSNVVGYIKGKSAILIARHFAGKTRNFTGENFWVRGYYVSTIGLDEKIGFCRKVSQ
jgi:putative transposase